MSLSLNFYPLPIKYPFTPVIDHAPGMCLSDSPAQTQAEGPTMDRTEFSPYTFDEETSNLQHQEISPTTAALKPDEATTYLESKLVTYRMSGKVTDSASTEGEENPQERHHSPIISTAPTNTTEEQRIDAALESYVRQSKNGFSVWL